MNAPSIVAPHPREWHDNSSMPVQIGQKRQADFDDPLGMLSDCHRRIETFLATLLAIARSFRGQNLDADTRSSLAGALEYFRHSGPRHTADEEESLFPRMRECKAGMEALKSIEALHADHVHADRAHIEIDALGTRWLNDGHLSETDAARLTAVLEELSGLYEHHIGVEDKEVFPTAGRVLSRDHLASIGEEMAQRRGVRRH
jgi:hemerythrin-like domain-containing protein